MSSDVIINKRSIYTGLDFLGDVGGLFDGLFGIGHFIIFLFSYISGDIRDNIVARKIFTNTAI